MLFHVTLYADIDIIFKYSLLIFNLWNDAGMTCHARREFLVPKLQYFLSFDLYLSQTKQENYSSDITPTSSKRKRRIIVYTIWSLVMVRESVASASGQY